MTHGQLRLTIQISDEDGTKSLEEVVRGLETAGQHGKAIGDLGLVVGMMIRTRATNGVPMVNKTVKTFGKEKNMITIPMGLGNGLTADNKKGVTLTKRKPLRTSGMNFIYLLKKVDAHMSHSLMMITFAPQVTNVQWFSHTKK